MSSQAIYSFSIPGFTTQREWSIYIVVATPTNRLANENKIYVGKVGDNNNGCNPIITRIGNHLSYYKVHSQLRNRLNLTTEFNYAIHFATFGLYSGKDLNYLDKINQLERELNKIIQSKIQDKSGYELLNALTGKSYTQIKEREKKNQLLLTEDLATLEQLANKAISE